MIAEQKKPGTNIQIKTNKLKKKEWNKNIMKSKKNWSHTKNRKHNQKKQSKVKQQSKKEKKDKQI